MINNKVKDGGLAFPVPCCPGTCTEETGHPGGESNSHMGMTLRDWFAGMAITGSLNLITEAAKKDALSEDFDKNDLSGEIAKSCYSIADKLIERRKEL